MLRLNDVRKTYVVGPHRRLANSSGLQRILAILGPPHSI